MKYINFQIDGDLEKEIIEFKEKRYKHMGLSTMFIELALEAIEEDKKK